MMKTTLLVPSLALLAALGWSQRDERPHLRLDEEHARIEYATNTETAVVVFEAESEKPLDRVFVRNAGEAPILALGSGDLALSGFVIEGREMDLTSLLRSYPEGFYGMSARTTAGQSAVGGAFLSHDLLPAPRVTYPLEGAEDVPPSFTVRWRADSSAEGYEVILEQGDSDTLRAKLPAGQDSFLVPPGVLAPGTESHVEVGVLSPSGNCTLVEVAFTTAEHD